MEKEKEEKADMLLRGIQSVYEQTFSTRCSKPTMFSQKLAAADEPTRGGNDQRPKKHDTPNNGNHRRTHRYNVQYMPKPLLLIRYCRRLPASNNRRQHAHDTRTTAGGITPANNSAARSLVSPPACAHSTPRQAAFSARSPPPPAKPRPNPAPHRTPPPAHVPPTTPKHAQTKHRSTFIYYST